MIERVSEESLERQDSGIQTLTEPPQELLNNLQHKRIQELQTQISQELQSQKIKELQSQKIKELQTQKIKELQTQISQELQPQKIQELQSQTSQDLQNFKPTQRPQEHSTKVNFIDFINGQGGYDNHAWVPDHEKGNSSKTTSQQKPEKGILSKIKSREVENPGDQTDGVANEVFVEKRPKLKRQESILTMSGFIIGGISEEDDSVFDSQSTVVSIEHES